MPVPATDEEAAKLGVKRLRFFRGYRPESNNLQRGPENRPGARRPGPPLTTIPNPEPAAETKNDSLQEPSIRSITEKMRDVARINYDATLRKFEVGSSDGTILQLVQYARELCEAELDLAKDSGSRLSALEPISPGLRPPKSRNGGDRYKAGAIPIQDYRCLTYRRLEAERWLEMEKLKAKKADTD